MLARISLILALTAATAFGLSRENVSQELTVKPGGKLVIDVAFGTIDVAVGADDKVAIDANRKIETSDETQEKKYLADVPIVISQDGDTVTISARKRGENSWDWTCSTTMDAHYRVRVPKNFNLDLRTGGGMIAASGVNGTTNAATGGGELKLAHLRGSVVAKTSGGSIALNGCEGGLEVKTSGGGISATDGGGALDAKTSGGSISVRNFNGDAIVKTSGGRLIFEKVNGRLVGNTSGGSIFAALNSPVPGDVHLVSSAGSIELTVPGDAAINLDAEASIGRVSNNLPIVATSSERDELHGVVNGGGKSVVLRSSAGSISISATSETAMQ